MEEKIFKTNSQHAGTHLIADFWGVKLIDNAKAIKNILMETARITKTTPLGIKIHKFSPQGITGFILLSESHISIHTWPEWNYVAIDIFACGLNSQPKEGLAYLKKEFQPKKVHIKTINR